ncbi:extracellular solute-binding protein [Balneatrix alpica]|uniref:extracellular solute-binding protein n=1 Tax=Balneatrix alpica TaxID=75684 RepID=UPI002739DFDB|nr:extracellular solute-binding protein [Balneatrix alpica]
MSKKQDFSNQENSVINQSRRSFLKTAAATSTAAAIFGGVAPAFISSRVLASSGEVNVFSWSDYIWPDMMESFEKATGIKINLSTYGTNAEAFNKLKASNGTGFDVIFPTVTNGNNYYPFNLLQALDESKLNVDAVIPSVYESSISLGATRRGERFLLPFNWGTEAITFDSSKRNYEFGQLSYADLWSEENAGMVTMRPKSALISLLLLMESRGEISTNRLADIYASEEQFNAAMDKAVEFAIANKSKVRLFWSNSSETTAAFKQNGCVIGQTWDGPGLTLQRESNNQFRYMMPKEGGLAWMDTMGIPSGAANVEQAYAFINHMLKPEVAAMHMNQSGYNASVIGAEEYIKPDVKAALQAAYPAEAVAGLWWWMTEPTWLNTAWQKHVDRFVAA